MYLLLISKVKTVTNLFFTRLYAPSVQSPYGVRETFYLLRYWVLLPLLSLIFSSGNI